MSCRRSLSDIVLICDEQQLFLTHVCTNWYFYIKGTGMSAPDPFQKCRCLIVVLHLHPCGVIWVVGLPIQHFTWIFIYYSFFHAHTQTSRVGEFLPSTQEGLALVVPATCPGKQEHLTVCERSSILFLLQQRWMATTSQVPCFTWYATEREEDRKKGGGYLKFIAFYDGLLVLRWFLAP